jgi:hypothetical protein
MEEEALLDRILENTPPLEPLHVELEPIHEEVSSTKADPVTPIERSSPEPKDLEGGFQPSNFLFFEDDIFEDFKNTSNYRCQKRPPVPVTPSEALDKEFLRESIKEFNAIYNHSKEVKHLSQEIQIRVPSTTVQCHISRNMVNVLYNPTIGANIMSTSLACASWLTNPLLRQTKPLVLGLEPD